MKIVVLDGYVENPGDLSWEELEKLGNLTVYDRTEAKDVISRIKNVPYIYTNKTAITREIMDASPELKFIGMLSTGYNVVDVVAGKEKGITVCNVPTYGTYAVAQFAIALLLELCHHIGHHDRRVKEGEWSNNIDWCFWEYPLIELAGKTMGIIGLGKIGFTTAQIAQAMGMKVLAYDQYPNKELECSTLQYVELEQLFSESDVITLHCPLFESTKGIINKTAIQKMKNGVLIINNSRGPLIIEEDLHEALVSGKVAGAGLDVLSVEPPTSDNILMSSPNCIITPHISWAPKEARARLMDVAVNNLKEFISGNIVNQVN
jgi:glycerate dehydrogenase